ncbi:ABC transporter ATP-binding protein [Marinitoga arctica]
MGKIIEVQNLKKYYGKIKAVNDISFEVKKGEIFSLLGPNGAGKTTTLEIIEGLRKKDDGEIIYFEKYTSPDDFYIKERIGVQLQSSAFLENLTVIETLKMFSGLYKNSLDINYLISKVFLEEKKNSMVKELSGGQKQRLAIAVALVNNPEIIFLDEPTTGLDPQARRMIWDLGLELKKDGKTIILTTHYMEEAEYLSDNINIIDHGKIIARGTIDDLIKQLNMETIIIFKTDYVKEFQQKFKGTVFDKKIEISTNNLESTLFEIIKYSKNNNLILDDIVIRKPNLEDVFLNLTGRTLRE